MRALVAILLLSKLLIGQDRPEVGEVLRQGMGLVDTGQLAAAQELYEKALDSFPGDADLRFELGMVHFRQRDWKKAIENFQSSLSAKPGKIKPLYYLAEVYYMESNLDLALETIGQAASIAPNDPQVCQKYGEYLTMSVETRKEGLSWLQKARRINTNLTRIDYQIGLAQFELSDFPAAASSFENALKRNSGDGQAAFFLAESRANLNEWENALNNYELALAQGYSVGSANYGRGRALVELGEFEAAVAPLQRAIAIQPSLIQAHFQLGRAYRQLGRTGDAHRETRLFAAMTNRIDTSREMKGPEEEIAWKKVKPLVEANKEQEALELLAQLPNSSGVDRSEPHYLLGVVYYSIGRHDDAMRLLRIARKQVPDSARIAACLGLSEFLSGQIAPAETLFLAALKLDSSEVLALIGLGTIRYQQQRWADATDYLASSRTADATMLYYLCDAYFRMNRTEEALLTAELIRAFGSENKTLLNSLDNLLALHRVARQPSIPQSENRL